MTDRQAIMVGMRLGRYELVAPIASGGMASVWLARLRGSRGFSKTVAIKTMLPALSDDDHFEKMFLDEATIASRIRHPNVVEILDLGEQDDILYLVMEWVDGEPLGTLRRAAARQGGLPLEIAVRIVLDACAGLHAAHELRSESGDDLMGIVHRDISPQNVLVTFDGHTKIVDFGVAKAAGRTAAATNAGEVKGKPPYMSPEQAWGESVDRRTDVFALGILLYQLTTGRHPFRGESDLVTLQNIVSPEKRIVPPRAYDRSFPPSLEEAILRALERERELRFQTMADFAAALERISASELPRATHTDVAAIVGRLLGDRANERRQRFSSAIAEADDRPSDAGSGPFTPPTFAEPVPLALSRTEAVAAVGRTPQTSPTVASRAGATGSITGAILSLRRSEPSKRVWGVALGVVVAAGFVVAWRASTAPGDPVTNDTAEATDPAPASPAPAAVPAVAPAPPPEENEANEAEAVILVEEPSAHPVLVPNVTPIAAPSAPPSPLVRLRARVPDRDRKQAPVHAEPTPRPATPAAPKKPRSTPGTTGPSGGFVPPPVTNPGF